MRTGPLVERGVRAARPTQTSSAAPRFAQAASRSHKRINPSVPVNGVGKQRRTHLECRLPINLREFIADQLGAVLNQSDDAVLSLAEHADEATLSRLARAIRRYSTKRAQQSWQDCSIRLAEFVIPRDTASTPVALCLRCARIEFGDDAVGCHNSSKCVTLNLSEARQHAEVPLATEIETAIATHLRRLIEEFRQLRAAFGLPHFKLDCYVHGDHVTFTWRPLS